MHSGYLPEECLTAARSLMETLATFEIHGLIGPDGLLRQELAG